MAIKTIAFEKDGPPLMVGVEILTPQVATYTLILWEAKSNTVVMEKKGNNENPEDDVFPLPTPCAINDNRVVEGTITLIDPEGPGGEYECRLAFTQGEHDLGSVGCKGQMTKPSEQCTAVARVTCS